MTANEATLDAWEYLQPAEMAKRIERDAYILVPDAMTVRRVSHFLRYNSEPVQESAARAMVVLVERDSTLLPEARKWMNHFGPHVESPEARVVIAQAVERWNRERPAGPDEKVVVKRPITRAP